MPMECCSVLVQSVTGLCADNWQCGVAEQVMPPVVHYVFAAVNALCAQLSTGAFSGVAVAEATSTHAVLQLS